MRPGLVLLAGWAASCAFLLAGCSESPSPSHEPGEDAGPEGDGGGGPVDDEQRCPSIYDPDIVPTFEMEISDESWAAIQAEFAAMTVATFHPLVSFRYGDDVTFQADVRLKGTSSLTWIPPKMQFVVSFNEQDRGGRFLGLRNLALDSPPYDPSLLHERVAMSAFRDVGVPAPCANNARLMVNGEYYGVYANVERVDRELLERRFGGAHADGNLFQHGFELETNEDDADLTHYNEWVNATTIEQARAMMDVDVSLLEWAVEAVLPDWDGFFCCSHNHFLYDHPARGFLYIPADKDITFDAHESLRSRDPEVPIMPLFPNFPVSVMLNDPGGMQQFLDAIQTVRTVVPTETLLERVDLWSAQIAEAMEEDPNRVFTFEEHVSRVAQMRQFIPDRMLFVDAWTSCMESDPTSPDACPDCSPTVIGDRTFLLCNEAGTWDEALAGCQERGGTLGVPRSAEEQKALGARVSRAPGVLWLGATDVAVEGTYTDAEGDALDYLGFPGEPPVGDGQDCVIANPVQNGEWDDRFCRERHGMVCALP